MDKTQALTVIREKYEKLLPVLTERGRRHWAATEALALSRSGITLVAQATGLSRTTITTGIRELLQQPASENHFDGPQRSRRPGGGRHRLCAADPTLLRDLEALVAPATRGHPQSPLRWTCKSTRNLAEELRRQGHGLSHVTVASLLEELGYSLQAPRKTRELVTHPDRNAQFEYINRQVRSCQRRGQPVISVDTKKKELVTLTQQQ